MKDDEALSDAIAEAIREHLRACEPLVSRRVTVEEIAIVADQAATRIKRISARRAKVLTFPKTENTTWKMRGKRRASARATLRGGKSAS